MYAGREQDQGFGSRETGQLSGMEGRTLDFRYAVGCHKQNQLLSLQFLAMLLLIKCLESVRRILLVSSHIGVARGRLCNVNGIL
jgi:hypothetical protein